MNIISNVVLDVIGSAPFYMGRSTAPGFVKNWPLNTPATSRKFYPEYANGSVITFTSGTLKVNGSAETSPYTHATGDYYEMTVTSHATLYETDVTMTLLDDGVAASVFTVTTIAGVAVVPTAHKESGADWLTESGTQVYQEG